MLVVQISGIKGLVRSEIGPFLFAFPRVVYPGGTSFIRSEAKGPVWSVGKLVGVPITSLVPPAILERPFQQ